MPPRLPGSVAWLPKLGPSTEFGIRDLTWAGCPALLGLHRQIPDFGSASDPLEELARGGFRRLFDEFLPPFFRFPMPFPGGLRAHLLQVVPLALLRGEVRASYRWPVRHWYRLLLDT
eukprot:6415575-Amphidinium_carterae.1